MRKNRLYVTIYLLICVLCICSVSSFAAEKLSPEEDYKVRNFLYEGADLLAKNETARALARFNSAKKIAPENPQCYYWIALAYSDLQNFGVAAKNAETAVLLDKDYSTAWLLWGQCLLFQSKIEDAAKKLDKAFVLEPDNYLIPFNLGRCYYYGFEGKQKKKSIQYFRKAWQLNPDFTPARFMMGCAELDEELYPLAIVSFKTVIKRDPMNEQAHFRLGLAYRYSKEIANARNEFNQALAINPQDYEAHLQLGHIYIIETPSRERALKHFNAFLQYAPADHPWRQRIANLLKRDQERNTRRRSAPVQ